MASTSQPLRNGRRRQPTASTHSIPLLLDEKQEAKGRVNAVKSTMY